MSVRIEIKGENKLNKLFNNFDSVRADYEAMLKKSTLQMETLVKAKYLTVKDGNTTPSSVRGGRIARRTRRGGLRFITGNLFRNTRASFRNKNNILEGAVGTNVSYGAIQEQKEKYAFLAPALKEMFPLFRQGLSRIMKAKLVK